MASASETTDEEERAYTPVSDESGHRPPPPPSGDIDDLFNAILVSNSAQFLKAFPDDPVRVESVLLQVYKHGDLKGNLIYWAALKKQRAMLQHMKRTAPQLFTHLALPVAHRFIQLMRYPAAQLLLEVDPGIVSLPEEKTNVFAIHVACSRQRPHVPFLRFLSSLKGFDVNVADVRGKTALHLIAQHSRGVEGRLAARFLLSRGADPLHCDIDGRLPSTCCTNPHVYRALSVLQQSADHARHLPELDPDTKSFIETADLAELKALPLIEDPMHASTVLSPNGLRATSPSPGASPSRRLALDEQDSLVQRLFDNSISHKEHWYQSQMSVIKERDDALRKTLSPDDIQNVVSRLHDAEMEQRQLRMEQTVAKYIKEVPEEEKRVLSPEELQESVTRQTTGAFKKIRDVHRKLTEQYAPEPEARKLSGAEQLAVAQRLHDQSRTHMAETMGKLYSTYCSSMKGRFSGAKIMTVSEWKAMGDRLAHKT